MDPTVLLTVLAILAILALAGFSVSRGFGLRFKGWGIELCIEKQE
ncbi:hypothetical protein [Novipirellula rosea]|uniref:Preprotein translocase subunit SecG n=1 Tax=Novipirellula rosea TaxID=1031540 RepID=A0ABP8MAN3_9BACT